MRRNIKKILHNKMGTTNQGSISGPYKILNKLNFLDYYLHSGL